MKKLQSYFYTLVAVSMLASCSQSDEILPAADESANLQIELSVDSRANLINALPNNSQYYISCNKQTSVVDFADGVSTIKSPITLTKYSSQVTAYYPYSKSGEEMYKLEGIWPINAVDDIDYMYGTSNNVSVYSPRATVTMHHALSCIRIHISPNSYLAEDIKESVSVQSMLMRNLPTQGYIQGTQVYSYNKPDVVKFTLSANKFTNGEIVADHFCLPYSKYDDFDKVIEISLGGGYGTVTIGIPYSKWSPQSGKVYNYYVTIDGKHEGTLLPTVTVEDWKTQNSGEIIIK